MTKQLPDKQYKAIRHMFADSIYNLALTENRNSDLDEWQLAYYRGIIITTISGIMGYTGRNWYDAMIILYTLLPLAHVNLHIILPETWRDVIDSYGNVDIVKCRKLGATLP